MPWKLQLFNKPKKAKYAAVRGGKQKDGSQNERTIQMEAQRK
jgi:hypothetical protein